jgi:hypothetical protein
MKSLKVWQLRQVLAAWESFNINCLNISSVKAQYLVQHFSSLVGKDFKIILQSAPFVLYQFMTDEQRALWISLGQLATYIFETRIHNMHQYLAELRARIDIFLWHIVNMSARWVNKPKFHMLIHLPKSIERFGPACLFATENFESFNSVLRTASIHSNRLRPGRDLGVSFLDYQALRLVLSNARLFNHKTRFPFYASTQVTKIFSTNPIIQKSMGYNPESAAPTNSNAFPTPIPSPLCAEDKQDIPSYFSQFLDAQVTQISQLRLTEKDVIKRGCFVLVNSLFN